MTNDNAKQPRRNLCNCPNCQTDNCPAALELADCQAKLREAERKLNAPKVSAGQRCKAGHDGSWVGYYGTCMVCRAEAAEVRAERLKEALQKVIETSDRFVQDTGMKHGDMITDAIDVARATLSDKP